MAKEEGRLDALLADVKRTNAELKRMRKRSEQMTKKFDDLVETAGDPNATALATAEPRRRRGFAAMPREQVSAIASKGGKSAHAAGTAHRWTSEQAKAAGEKGGRAPHSRRGRQVPPPLESEELDEPKGAA